MPYRTLKFIFFKYNFLIIVKNIYRYILTFKYVSSDKFQFQRHSYMLVLVQNVVSKWDLQLKADLFRLHSGTFLYRNMSFTFIVIIPILPELINISIHEGNYIHKNDFH